MLLVRGKTPMQECIPKVLFDSSIKFKRRTVGLKKKYKFQNLYNVTKKKKFQFSLC